ncbi:zinc finger protein 79-like [Takifugu rubripes]|uniref:zinc finger protein 79-like n=1 Tax=Takifugu rubripes TaxID=31033 RepID=UPI0005D1FE6B|nr:zinc finger protein 79-like [Takifugu rubripes]|eukprot:XP_011607519.1 PREDICTED: zinc finger protein 79-like [Takifugu rubripes]
MSKIEMLRLLINQRLTAAAEEIFRVFGKTIALYEEEISRSRQEIDRQRRLLDLSRTPQICIQAAAAAPGEHQDSSSSLDQDIKEEEAEPSEQESTLTREEGWATPPPCITVKTTEEVDDSVPDLELAILAQQTQLDLEEKLSEDLDPRQSGPAGEQVPRCQVLDSYRCTVCGRVLAQRAQWAKHMQSHRKDAKKVDRSYTCDVCGKRLTRFDGYRKHLRVHTGEKPYSCHQCGRRFSDNSNFKRHVRTHVGQKPQQR